MSVNSEMTALADQVRRLSGETGALGISDMTDVLSEVNIDIPVGSLVIGNINLHDSSADIAGTYLKNGAETAYSGWSATDYIPVEAGVTYACISMANSIQGQYCAKYDSTKKYVNIFAGGIYSLSGGDAVMLFRGSGGYIRFSGIAAAITALAIYKCTGTYEFSAEVQTISTVSDDSSDTMALDTLMGGGPAE